MTVFISHSSKNRIDHDNVADWLDQLGIEYWQQTELKSAASLRDQLRAAVVGCDVCIFVATFDSVNAPWCISELGAFWGAGVPIIVYQADSSMVETDLPPVVQGDKREAKPAAVARRAAELGASPRSGSAGPNRPIALVGDLTVEELENLVASAVSLARASEKDTGGRGSDQILRDVTDGALRGAGATSRLGLEPDEGWRRRILWVDDRPSNNTHERKAFAAFGFEFTLATSTDLAIDELAHHRFAAVISDMGRREGPREGYVLLEKLRSRDAVTPFFIYAGSRSPEHVREGLDRGAQGVTNNPSELIELVTGVVAAG